MRLIDEYKAMEHGLHQEVMKLLKEYNLNYKNIESEKIESIYAFFYEQKFKKENALLLIDFRRILAHQLEKVDLFLEENVLNYGFVEVAEDVCKKLDYITKTQAEKEEKLNKIFGLMLRHYLHNTKKTNPSYNDMEKFLFKINWNSKVVDVLIVETLNFYQFKSLDDAKRNMYNLFSRRSTSILDCGLLTVTEHDGVKKFILNILNKTNGKDESSSYYHTYRDNSKNEIRIDKKMAQLLEKKNFVNNLSSIKSTRKYGWKTSEDNGCIVIKLKSKMSNEFFNLWADNIIKELNSRMDFELLNRRVHEETLMNKMTVIKDKQNIAHIIRKKKKI